MGIDVEIDLGYEIRRETVHDLCAYVRHTYELTVKEPPPVQSEISADLFYHPYVPLQKVPAIDTPDYNDDFEEWLQCILDNRHK